MNFLIAPNAFKGTLSATEAAGSIAKAVGESAERNVLIQPVADGGDGTCSLLMDSLQLEKIPVLALNALGKPSPGFYGWDPLHKITFLDVSTVSGLGMLAEYERDPLVASTFGTGILIQKAIAQGAQEIVLGLGGSATVDLGLGILAALGILFLDEKGRSLPVFSPDFLEKIKHIQRPPQVPWVRFICLCDVKNYFLGENGAVSVFGPQKGLHLDQIPAFEKSCEKVLQLLILKSKKDWQDQPGFGAAGGIGMGLGFFFPTEIKFGASYFLNLVGLKEKLRQVDWVITGEGQYDSQSDQGKASFELLQLAKSEGKKIALITSGTGGRGSGFDLVLELPSLDFSKPDFKEKARQNLDRLITEALAKGLFS